MERYPNSQGPSRRQERGGEPYHTTAADMRFRSMFIPPDLAWQPAPLPVTPVMPEQRPAAGPAQPRPSDVKLPHLMDPPTMSPPIPPPGLQGLPGLQGMSGISGMPGSPGRASAPNLPQTAQPAAPPRPPASDAAQSGQSPVTAWNAIYRAMAGVGGTMPGTGGGLRDVTATNAMQERRLTPSVMVPAEPTTSVAAAIESFNVPAMPAPQVAQDGLVGLVGPTGPVGPMGPAGLVGPIGPRGPAGVTAAVAFGGRASVGSRVIQLDGAEVTLALPDGFGDAFGVGLDEPDALTISVGGVYAVEYELAVRYAAGVGQLRLTLCRNGRASPGAFVERMAAGVPGEADDPMAARLVEVCLRGKAFMLLDCDDRVSLRVSSPDTGFVETCGGMCAYITVQLLRASEMGGKH